MKKLNDKERKLFEILKILYVDIQKKIAQLFNISKYEELEQAQKRIMKYRRAKILIGHLQRCIMI